MTIGEVDRLTGALEGVRRTTADGLAQWRYHGRLVARQLDDTHMVIRADFDYRASALRQFPPPTSPWRARKSGRCYLTPAPLTHSYAGR